MSSQATYELPERRSISTTPQYERYRERVVFKEVESIAVVGTPVNHPEGQSMVFHFRLSFVLKSTKAASSSFLDALGAEPSSQGSIRLDMNPSLADVEHLFYGEVQVEYKPYAFSSTPGPKPFVVPVIQPELTVADVLNCVLNVNLADRYEFKDMDTGDRGHWCAGCRHWCAKVVDMLSEAGILASDVGDKFVEWEDEEHSRLGHVFIQPREKGRFYEGPYAE